MKSLSGLAAESPASAIAYAPIGTRIWFSEEKSPYRVRARSSRYLVCTKPFNLRRTTIYCIVDLEENVRGPENLVLGMGAESDEDCVNMVKRLHGISEPPSPKHAAEIKALPIDLRAICERQYDTPTEVTHRNRIPVRVARVLLP